MANKPDVEIKPDEGGEASLTRNFEIKHGAQVLVSGDHMVWHHQSGEVEDVLVIQDGGKRKVQRFRDTLGAITSSPRGYTNDKQFS